MVTKEWVLAVLEKMPEKFSADDFIKEIYLTKKIEIARQQFKEGDFLTDEQLAEEISKWN